MTRNYYKTIIMKIILMILFLLIFTKVYSQFKFYDIAFSKDSIYLDASIGYNWFLDINGNAIWYEVIGGKRIYSNFDDVIYDSLKWQIHKDTIFFFLDNSRKPFSKYQIINTCTQDSSFTVKNLNENGAYKYKTLEISPNQINAPARNFEYEIFELDSNRLKKIFPPD